MTAQPGYIAIIQFGPTPTTITGIKSVDIKIGTDILDITALADGAWKKKIGGLSDYTLSLSGNLDMTDTEQAALQANIITNPGTSIAWLVAPKGLGTGLPKYTGTVLVKSEGIKIDVKSEQQISIDLEGTGAIVAGTQ
jgi:predicted secreted protein